MLFLTYLRRRGIFMDAHQAMSGLKPSVLLYRFWYHYETRRNYQMDGLLEACGQRHYQMEDGLMIRLFLTMDLLTASV